MKTIMTSSPIDHAVNEPCSVKKQFPIKPIPGRLTAIMMAAWLTVFQLFPSAAFAESPVRLNNFGGAIDFSGEGPVRPFVLSGTASHLGQFTCYGEAEFLPGETEGSLVGEGVAVFEAANGDRLVGVVTWHIDPEGTLSARFPWRDSVEFSDGTVASPTGRFLTDRPPGALIVAEYLFVATILIIGIIVG